MDECGYASVVAITSTGATGLTSPPQAHMHLLCIVASGTSMKDSNSLGGAQGSTTTGTQGIGVSTPSAAAVAAITSGFSMLLHIPKLGMFTSGAISSIVAVSSPMISGLPGSGSAWKGIGASPKLHSRGVSLVRNSGIAIVSRSGLPPETAAPHPLAPRPRFPRR